jgi:hypothetical protein
VIDAYIIRAPDDGSSNTSETSLNFCQTTRRNNPEDNHLHTHRLEKLKSYFYVRCQYTKGILRKPMPIQKENSKGKKR